MISRLSAKILSLIPDVRTRLALVMIAAAAVLGAVSTDLMRIVMEIGESQGWIRPANDHTMGFWIITIAIDLAIYVVALWIAAKTFRRVERALVLAESDAAEPLEREPLWIPGTDYRADCAVGQLRPWGMRPCSDEPFYRRLLTRFNDRPELCRQHTYPTDPECRRRALRCLVRAHEWTAAARVAESEPRRDQCLDVAAWFQGRGELYRRYLRCGLTAAGVEWEPVRFDAVLAGWDAAVATDPASTEREPAALAAD